MPTPLILSWSTMPFKIIAKAWTDSAFKTDLLANPNDVIQNTFFDVPTDYNFIISQDTASTRHFPLPYLTSEFTEWTQGEVLDRLIYETAGDISMQYFLPAWVINKAFFDATYKSNLLNIMSPGGANAALNAAGYNVPAGMTYYAIANTSTNHNIALPLMPVDWAALDYNSILQRLLFNASQAMAF